MVTEDGTTANNHPVSLIRSNGLVRERRIGEPWKDRSSGPVPYPRIAEASGRVEQEEYLALASEYAAKRRRAEEAMPGARTELQQSTAIETMSRLESAYAGRFLALAEKHKGDSVAADALISVVTNEFTPRESEQAAAILIRDHLHSKAMRPLCTELGSLHMVFSRAGEKRLAGCPDRRPDAHGSGRRLPLPRRASQVQGQDVPEADGTESGPVLGAPGQGERYRSASGRPPGGFRNPSTPRRWNFIHGSPRSTATRRFATNRRSRSPGERSSSSANSPSASPRPRPKGRTWTASR